MPGPYLSSLGGGVAVARGAVNQGTWCERPGGRSVFGRANETSKERPIYP